MVAQVVVDTGSYLSYMASPKSMVVPGEVHPYPGRSMKINESYYSNYLQGLKSMFYRYENSPEKIQRLSTHLNDMLLEFEYAKNNSVRYTDFFDGISTDSIGSLEASGTVDASKNYQIIVSLKSFLPHLLAFLCKESVEEMESRIRANCSKYDIQYQTFCDALCTGNQESLSHVDINCLFGLSTYLDSTLEKIIRYPHRALIHNGDSWLDLRSQKYTKEQRITTYLFFQIATLQQLILNGVISYYSSMKSPGFILTSKGMSMLVFQSEQDRKFTPISVELGSTCTLSINPVTLRRGSYCQALAEGWI